MVAVAGIGVLLALVVAPACAVAATRYCGVVTSFGPSDVVLTGGGSCATARSVAKATAKLAPVGNSPGSPKGWQCARITGQPPTGLQCTRGPSTISWFSTPDGPATSDTPATTTGCTPTTGVGRITTRGIPCAVAINVIVLLDSELPTVNGPVGYGCRRTVVGRERARRVDEVLLSPRQTADEASRSAARQSHGARVG